MIELEVIDVIEVITALCPGQKWAPGTPYAWSVVLDDVDRNDAMAAVRKLYRDRGNEKEFGPRRIEADDILAEVRRIRADRLRDYDPEALVPPAGLSVLEDIAYQRAAVRALADGKPLPVADRGQLVQGPRIRALTRDANTA